MVRLFSRSLLLGVMLSVGCTSTPRVVTLEDELVQTFGSFENACEATVTIIPNIHRKALQVELSREDGIQVLETLRGCTRFYDGPEAWERHWGLGNCPSPVDNKIKVASAGREFFVNFTDIGFLCSYLCPTPDSVAYVNFILKYCMEECVKRYEESVK